MSQTIDSAIIPVSTTDATPQDLLNYEVPLQSMLGMDVEVYAYRNQTNRAYWKIHAVGSRANGNASALGTPTEERKRNDSGASTWSAQVLLSGNNLVIRITGQASTTISWMVKANITINTPE
jgi:hypothetical protein